MYLRSCYKLVGDSISHRDCYHQDLASRIKKFQHLATKVLNIQLLANNVGLLCQHLVSKILKFQHLATKVYHLNLWILKNVLLLDILICIGCEPATARNWYEKGHRNIFDIIQAIKNGMKLTE